MSIPCAALIVRFSARNLRWNIVLAVGLSALSSVPASLFSAEADDGFPFTAFVARDRTQLRSGPSDDHYATDLLDRGKTVEVFQRADGGWLAIRPPRSSFSWISQRDLQVADDASTGRVVGAAAVSWIGSNVGDVAEHRWLVKLERGEDVAVLGKERRRVVADGKSDVYYRIAPPAGEFRWLHEDDIVRDEKELAAIRDPHVAAADFRVSLRGSPRAAPRPAELKQEPSADEPAKRDNFSARARESTAIRGAAGEVASLLKRDDSQGKSSAFRGRTLPDQVPSESQTVATSGDFESRLRQLDAHLALLAAQPVEQWSFAALRDEAERLATAGQSTLERARVQLFVDKLAEFDGLRSRHALLAPKPANLATSRGLLSFPDRKARTDNSIDPRFDGTGWLLPVTSTKRNSPPFALLDQDGNILQFVSPAPGLNLGRYVKKEIGIFGQKDQPNTLDKPHVTASRVVELDRHRR